MEDETVLIVNKNVPTGYSTTMRSWMKPDDVIFMPGAVSITPFIIPVVPEVKPAEPKPKKGKVRK